MGRTMKCGIVCMCLECCAEEETCPPTLRSPDSDKVMAERAEEGQRQTMLDNILALCQGKKQ